MPLLPNIHHLELFYYVVLFQGISNAARRMPYGLQQPGISKQMLTLERELGFKLFERKPFQLTPAGKMLFDIAREFFDKLPTLRERLQRCSAPHLRIAASEFVLREYLIEVVKRMRELNPDLQWDLRAGTQQQMKAWLADETIDLAIAALDGPPTGFEWLPITPLPLALLAPKHLRITTPEQFWADDRLARPLVSPPAAEGVCELFRRGLQQRGVVWAPTVQTSSTALVTWHVAMGNSVGVSINLPRLVQHPKIRVIPVSEFAPVTVAALWRGPASPLLQSLIKVIDNRAHELWPKRTIGSVIGGRLAAPSCPPSCPP